MSDPHEVGDTVRDSNFTRQKISAGGAKESLQFVTLREHFFKLLGDVKGDREMGISQAWFAEGSVVGTKDDDEAAQKLAKLARGVVVMLDIDEFTNDDYILLVTQLNETTFASWQRLEQQEGHEMIMGVYLDETPPEQLILKV